MSLVRRTASRSPVPWPLLSLLLLLTAAAAVAQDADHLLLSEVVVEDRFGSPFIEIVNPTGGAVDLTDVYLSTGHDDAFGQLYWNVVTGQDAKTARQFGAE